MYSTSALIVTGTANQPHNHHFPLPAVDFCPVFNSSILVNVSLLDHYNNPSSPMPPHPNLHGRPPNHDLDELEPGMQNLAVQEPVSYPPYNDFQPFIPYPQQTAFPTLNPNIVNPANGYPYSYPTMRYSAHSDYASTQTSPQMPSSPYAPRMDQMWNSPPMSPAMGFPPQGSMIESYGGQGYYPPPQSSWGHASSAWNSRPPRNPIPTPLRSGTFNRMSWSGPSKQDAKTKERKAYHPKPPANRSEWVMWVGNV